MTDGITIVATGPLTSDALSRECTAFRQHHLYFYDSISPIVEADSIDMSRVYMAARYDKGTADYINCPFTKEEYDAFHRRADLRRSRSMTRMGEAELL